MRNVIRQLNCFVIMPFSGAAFERKDKTTMRLEEGDFNKIWNELFRPAIKGYKKRGIAFGRPIRYKEKYGNFVKGIVQHLDKDELVIADLTGLRPNVCYELGVRHALKRGTIIVTQDMRSIPADLANYHAIPYTFPEKITEISVCLSRFKKQLYKVIDDFLFNERDDNPVLDFLGTRESLYDRKEQRTISANIELLSSIRNEYKDNMHEICKCLKAWKAGKGTDLYEIVLCAEPVLQRLVSSYESLVPRETSQVIGFLEDILSCVRINQKNMQLIKDALMRGDTASAWKKEFGFRDKNRQYYSIFKLKKNYFDRNKKTYCSSPNTKEPILESFNYFIRRWSKHIRDR